jgi:hypothetical protein
MTTCTENVEKVVNPPSRPTPIASRVPREPRLSDQQAQQERTGDVDSDRGPQERLVMQGEA